MPRVLCDTATWIASALLTACSIAWPTARGWSIAALVGALVLYALAFLFHERNDLEQKRAITGIAILGIVVAGLAAVVVYQRRPVRANAQVNSTTTASPPIAVTGTGNQVISGNNNVVTTSEDQPSERQPAKRSRR